MQVTGEEEMEDGREAAKPTIEDGDLVGTRTVFRWDVGAPAIAFPWKERRQEEVLGKLGRQVPKQATEGPIRVEGPWLVETAKRTVGTVEGQERNTPPPLVVVADHLDVLELQTSPSDSPDRGREVPDVGLEPLQQLNQEGLVKVGDALDRVQ
jgi:hypothetical protein